MIFLTSSMLGGHDSDFFATVIPMFVILVFCGAWALKQPKYIHFVNLTAFLFPIFYMLDDMKMGLPLIVVGVGAFLLGGGLRFMFTTISFYVSVKKKS